MDAVEQKIGFKRAWIYAQIQAGKFPKQVKVGGRASRWVESHVDDWIAARIAADGNDGVEP
jgi:prophage regulatory protein